VSDKVKPASPAPGPWRPPTRRAFVAMLGAAAATLALRDRTKLDPPPAKPRWIGHC